MAVAIRTTGFPEGVGTPDYDAVVAELNLAGDPPGGLLFHWAGEVDGAWTITEVWESREDHDRFQDDRLFPSIRKVTGASPASGTQVTVTEFAVHNHVRV